MVDNRLWTVACRCHKLDCSIIACCNLIKCHLCNSCIYIDFVVMNILIECRFHHYAAFRFKFDKVCIAWHSCYVYNICLGYICCNILYSNGYILRIIHQVCLIGKLLCCSRIRILFSKSTNLNCLTFGKSCYSHHRCICRIMRNTYFKAVIFTVPNSCNRICILTSCICYKVAVVNIHVDA